MIPELVRFKIGEKDCVSGTNLILQTSDPKEMRMKSEVQKASWLAFNIYTSVSFIKLISLFSHNLINLSLSRFSLSSSFLSPLLLLAHLLISFSFSSNHVHFHSLCTSLYSLSFSLDFSLHTCLSLSLFHTHPLLR